MVDEYAVACSGCGAEWRSRDPVPPLDHCPICPVSDRELDAMIAQLEAERAAKVKSLEEEVERLRAAATALYRHRWVCDELQPGEQAALWESLRDAIGLPPGTATSMGVEGQ